MCVTALESIIQELSFEANKALVPEVVACEAMAKDWLACNCRNLSYSTWDIVTTFNDD